ncbi:YeeE/YedE family protein [Polynucleobacter kasalickyi]|uniref:Uncharacterized protein n=1 Tax=Polynucleobacter kasalickyi TaxID=1938817 RepID=A0A1W1Y9E7_9BURK|nr:hypothetical protein SAMN06296008_10292 [Polynucleobacter kasalickyi]
MITINWHEFTPQSALAGGILIGLAAAILALFNGRIMGVSGIVSQLFTAGTPPKEHFRWHLLFIFGMLLAPMFYRSVAYIPKAQDHATILQLIIAGTLVGIGTRLGSGCTSGHGVCGLGRLSPRSLIATLCFMGSGFIAGYYFLHGVNS